MSRPRSTRTLPSKVGRYRILDRIGKGAMGVVYSAQDDKLERTVAIKVMMTDLEADPETRERFYREARSAGQLLHRNIITVFDMGEEDGRPFIVMELLRGEVLGDYLARPETVALEQKLDLMMQMYEGLSVAHDNGIVHRDIKPGNLFVREEGGLKILDFGIARLAASSMTMSGFIVGTPDYMSPEQTRGKEVDQRSDIFSAGAVFYFVLTGRKPFAAPDLPAVLHKVESVDPLPLRETEAPPALAQIVMKTLAKSPAGRYQHCREVLTDLLRFKRTFDAETRTLAEAARQRLADVVALTTDCRHACERLETESVESDDAFLRGLEEKHPIVVEWRTSEAMVPIGRASVVHLRDELSARHGELEARRAQLQAVETLLAEGERALAGDDLARALECFDVATRTGPVSRRARLAAEACRQRVAERQANDEGVRALLAEAQDAATSRRWAAVVELCEQALAVAPSAAQVTALRDRAVRALEIAAVERRQQVRRALDRAESLCREQQFDEVEAEIAFARSHDPDSTLALEIEGRVQAARLEAIRATELDRRATKAIAAARAEFSAGRRAEAIAALEAFVAEQPQANVAAEVARLSAEAQRLAVLERQREQVAAHTSAATAALEAEDPDEAWRCANLALALDSTDAVALRIHGLATARLRERAAAEARMAAAARHLQSARELMGRSKYRKAREEAHQAARVHPAGEEASALLAEIDRAEAQAAAELEAAARARQRAKAAQPALEMARAALAAKDFQRASWAAENALALDPANAQARQILQAGKDALAAELLTADAEDTVDLTRPVDSDDTASIAPLQTPWQRLMALVVASAAAVAARVRATSRHLARGERIGDGR